MPRSTRHSIWFHLLDVLLNIAIIVGIVVGIRTFLISPFQVQGSSMLDTLEHRQYIIINKLAYIVGSPERGDVVVFRPPTGQKRHYVKRVIGIPGDEVILRNGMVYLKTPDTVSEIELNENYLSSHNEGQTYNHPPSSGNTEEKRYLVPEGKYFLMGDNRQASLDSRSFGSDTGKMDAFVPRSNISGRVWFVLLPLSKIHALELPNYGLE